jgi:hypothetical protein
VIICGDDSFAGGAARWRMRRMTVARSKRRATVTRSNMLYLIIGALVIVAAVLGYQLYQDRHQPEGLNINVGPGGLSIQGK